MWVIWVIHFTSNFIIQNDFFVNMAGIEEGKFFSDPL